MWGAKYPLRLSGIYGEPNRAKRKDTWDLIRNSANSALLSWCLIGDMNNVLSQSDKRGGRLYPQWLIQGFQEVLDNCNITNMNLLGYPFTWERGYEIDKWIEVRLDRALVNLEFTSMFKEAKLTNLELTTSDHCPLLLEPNVSIQVKCTKKFRFENAWMRDPMCGHIIEKAWTKNPHSSLLEKISQCAEKLAVWRQEITRSLRDHISQSKNVIKTLKGRRDANSIKLVLEEKKKLVEVYTQKEVFW